LGAWAVLAVTGIAGVPKVADAANGLHHFSGSPTFSSPKLNPFDVALGRVHGAKLELRGGEDCAAKLQILRREQDGTRLEWLDTKDAVAGGKEDPEKRASPFFGHTGLAAADAHATYDILAYSPDGRLLARVQTPDERASVQSTGSVVSVIDTATGQQLLSLRGHSSVDTIQGVAFSPQGSYLVVSSRFRPAHFDTSASMWTSSSQSAGEGTAKETQVATGQDGNTNNNLAIWHVDTGSLAGAWSTHQHWDPDLWPYVQWRTDELLAAFAQPGALVVFRALESPPPLAHRLKEAGRLALGLSEACTFALAPLSAKDEHRDKLHLRSPHAAASLKLAIFVQEPNAHRVDIMEFTPACAADAGDEGGAQQDAEAPATWTTQGTLPLEGAEDLSLKWSVDGSSLLVLSTTHVDDTNQHYYGTTSLQLMHRDKRANKKAQAAGADSSAGAAVWLSSAIHMDRPGPIHDVAWSPTSNQFIVLYGSMPAKAVLYNAQAQAVFSFGTGTYNTVVWSPHGRFVCLGGFGNLAGKMSFWDVSIRLALGSATARCAIYRKFSPCSRFFLTAVTFPALRVDNELALWRYDGTLVYRDTSVEQLFQAEWKPQPAALIQDRSASPAVLERVTLEQTQDVSNSAAASSLSSRAAPEPFRRASFSLHAPNQEDQEHSAPQHLGPGLGSEQHATNAEGVPFGQTNQVKLSKSQLKRRKKKEKEVAARGPVF